MSNVCGNSFTVVATACTDVTVPVNLLATDVVECHTIFLPIKIHHLQYGLLSKFFDHMLLLILHVLSLFKLPYLTAMVL